MGIMLCVIIPSQTVFVEGYTVLTVHLYIRPYYHLFVCHVLVSEQDY